MEQVSIPSQLAKKQLSISIMTLLVVAGALGLSFIFFLSADTVYILLPLLVNIVLFLSFSLILSWKVVDNLFGELGFIYLSLVLAYTVLPAITILVLGSDLVSGWEKLSQLLPAPREMGIHLWRHVLFIFGIASGYLLVRGNKKTQFVKIGHNKSKDAYVIFFLIGLIVLCILTISFLSAPVSNYIDHYTRFDHLPGLLLRVVYICLIFKTASYFILLVYLFNDFKRYKHLIYLTVLILCSYETAYSFGSRIETLTILLASVCLYHYKVKPITLKKGLLSLVLIGTLFSVIELLRSSEFNLAIAKNVVEKQGSGPASEFGAVYFTSFHLYAERNQGALPPREWPMFFNDFIALVPFADHTRWHPEFWYARNYFPNAVVPPETMGPIADSAIWGGELDLLFRSLINGVIFALLMRWFLSNSGKWWAMSVYVYCYATCIMTLKYSVFYQLQPLFKIMIPGLLLVELFRRVVLGGVKSSSQPQLNS